MRVLICEFLPSKIKIQFLSHTSRILNVHKPDEARRYCGYKVFFLSLQRVLLDSVTLHNFKSERTGKSKSRCPLRAPDLSYQSTYNTSTCISYRHSNPTCKTMLVFFAQTCSFMFLIQKIAPPSTHVLKSEPSSHAVFPVSYLFI